MARPNLRSAFNTRTALRLHHSVRWTSASQRLGISQPEAACSFPWRRIAERFRPAYPQCHTLLWSEKASAPHLNNQQFTPNSRPPASTNARFAVRSSLHKPRCRNSPPAPPQDQPTATKSSSASWLVGSSCLGSGLGVNQLQRAPRFIDVSRAIGNSHVL